MIVNYKELSRFVNSLTKTKYYSVEYNIFN
jgi:hypothetical protein